PLSPLCSHSLPRSTLFPYTTLFRSRGISALHSCEGAYMNATQLLSADSPPVRPRAARRREPGLGSPPCVLRPLSSTVYPRPLSSTFCRRPFVLHLLSSAPAVRRPGPSPQGPRRPPSGAAPSGPPPSAFRGRALRAPAVRLPGPSPQGPSAFRDRALGTLRLPGPSRPTSPPQGGPRPPRARA